MNSFELDEARRVAYHESGHAVAAWAVGYELRKATIVPEGDRSGYVQLDSGNASSSAGAKVDWAGRVCERLAGYPWQAPAPNGDGANIEEGLRRSGRADDAEWQRDHDLKVTFELLRDPELWRAVEAVAAALMRSKTLDGAACEQIIVEAILQYRYELDVQRWADEWQANPLHHGDVD